MQCRSSNASHQIEDETCELLDGKSVHMNYPLHFLKSTKVCKGCKNKKIKKMTTGQDFFSWKMEYWRPCNKGGWTDCNESWFADST